MCENIIDLLSKCEDSYDEINYISIRNKILIGIGSKWSFNDLINIISQSNLNYLKFKIFIEILERRDGWITDIPQLIDVLSIKDNDGVLCELKLKLLYLLIINIDPLDNYIISKRNVFIDVLNNIFDNIQISLLKFLQRNTFFILATKLLDIFDIIDNDLFNVDFGFKVCNQIKGEKDPRNLLLMFPLLKKILTKLVQKYIKNDNFDLLCYEISQILLTYYPINFNPPKDAPQSITEDDLTNELNDALSFNLLWKYVIDVLIDGLYVSELDDSESLNYLDKNVKTIIYCLPNYGNECAMKYLPQVIEALSSECFLSTCTTPKCTKYSTDITIEYEILGNLEDFQSILELPSWIPSTKHFLLGKVLEVFIQNILLEPDPEELWSIISYILEISKNSIIISIGDMKTSIYIIKIVIINSPECIYNYIIEFLEDLILNISVKIENIPIFSQLISILITKNVYKSNIKGNIASKLHEILNFINDNICEQTDLFKDMIKMISLIKLPENYINLLCEKINKMDNFDANSEEMIVNLSKNKDSKQFLINLFNPIIESPIQLKIEESFLTNIENANKYFNNLSNTPILRYSPDNLSLLYNKLNDKVFFKRFCFVWTTSLIFAELNPKDYFWFDFTKSLSTVDQTIQDWLCLIINIELFSKIEFLDLLNQIYHKFNNNFLDFILETYNDNIYKLLFTPWLEKFYDVKHYKIVKKILLSLDNKDININDINNIKLCLYPILFKYPNNDFNEINLHLFGLIKYSELSFNNNWIEFMDNIVNNGKFCDILDEICTLLDELCCIRIIPGDTWQIVMDTWANPKNYLKSKRITDSMNYDLKTVLLDKIYFIDSDSYTQRISFANYLLLHINQYILSNKYKNIIYKCIIRLLSSIPHNLIEEKWINIIFDSIGDLELDWDDLRLLCLLAKLSRYKLLDSNLKDESNLKIIVNYCIKWRNMPLSRAISLLIIKEIWSIINSSLNVELCKTVFDYVCKCGKDSNRRVRRMALSSRQTVKLNFY